MQTIEIESYFDRVAVHQQRNNALTALQAGILAAAELGIANDSRTFAWIFGIEHALILRGLNALAERNAGIRFIRRDAV